MGKEQEVKISPISYVLPFYNEQDTIASSILSILSIKGEKELIVIDDASDDYSYKLIEPLLDRDDVTYIKNDKRGGAAKSRNIGNKLAKYDLIAVCDADLYYDFRGEAISEFFDHEPEMGVFHTSVDIEPYNSYRQKLTQTAYVWNFKSKCNISHPTVAYRKDIAMRYPYHEKSVETDLFEFMLLDMHRGGVQFSGMETPTVLKFEKPTKRNKSVSRKLKKQMYKEYGIKI